MKLIFPMVINRVSLEHCNHKPMEMYGGSLLTFVLGKN